MPTRRIRIVPRSDLLLRATGEGVSVQSGSAAATLSGGGSVPHPNEWSSSTVIWDKFATPWESTITPSAPAAGGTVGAAGTGRTYRYTTGNTGQWVQGTNSGGANYDAAAGSMPYNPSNVLRIAFNNTSPQGGGPEHMGAQGSGYLQNLGTFGKLYLHVVVMVSAGYRSPVGGVQKLFHCWGTADGYATGQGASLLVPSIFGSPADSTTGSLALQARLQNCGTTFAGADRAINLTGNVNGGGITVTRGTPIEFIMRAQMNTAGNTDGSLECWVKSAGVWTQRMSYTAIDWSGAGVTTKDWTLVQINPTYGGTGTINGTHYLYVDGPYLSVAS